MSGVKHALDIVCFFASGTMNEREGSIVRVVSRKGMHGRGHMFTRSGVLFGMGWIRAGLSFLLAGSVTRTTLLRGVKASKVLQFEWMASLRCSMPIDSRGRCTFVFVLKISIQQLMAGTNEP